LLSKARYDIQAHSSCWVGFGQRKPNRSLGREVVESPSLEVFKKTCSCGTSGYGVVGMVVLGGWLDLMILEAVFNL